MFTSSSSSRVNSHAAVASQPTGNATTGLARTTSSAPDPQWQSWAGMPPEMIRKISSNLDPASRMNLFLAAADGSNVGEYLKSSISDMVAVEDFEAVVSSTLNPSRLLDMLHAAAGTPPSFRAGAFAAVFGRLGAVVKQGVPGFRLLADANVALRAFSGSGWSPADGSGPVLALVRLHAALEEHASPAERRAFADTVLDKLNDAVDAGDRDAMRFVGRQSHELRDLLEVASPSLGAAVRSMAFE